ncbi:helix-turn-helix transcriptional regulator [Arthrobacter sp. NPDC090010]|uniref:helix-turn-helix transcriptional regulator n=1 Tax=Arthrobacter sp. NPDC090010 TaxID=3363942 RepID=UPI00380FF11A
MSARKTERILNLLIALLSTSRGHTRAYLESTVYAYCREEEGISEAALERMFERDKAELREMGVPLQTLNEDSAEADDGAGVRYRVSPEDYQLPEVALDARDRFLLQLAARMWEQGSLRAAGVSALRKLRDGGEDDDPASSVLPRISPGGAALEALHTALAGCHPVEFDYRAPQAATSRRRLHPYGLGNRAGQWYVSGLDLDRNAERTFRLNRIVGDVSVERKRAFERPDTFSIARVLEDMEEYPAQELILKLPSGRGADWRNRASRVDGDIATLSYRDETSIVDELTASAAVVQVLEPERLREAVRGRLERAWEAMTRAAPAVEFTKAAAKRGPKSSSETTVRRLLAMIPFLVRHGGIRKAELATEFGITPRQLDDDLTRIMMVGRPEGYHNDLMDIVDDGERVWIDNALDLAQPVRFSRQEAWTLLVGLDALEELGIEGDRSAIADLRLRLSTAAGDALTLASSIKVRVRPQGREAQYLAALREALERRERVWIDYVVPSRDEVTHRLVDPRALQSREQHWYLEAWCHTAEASRNFRLDRIARLEPSGERVDPALWTSEPAGSVYQPDDRSPLITVVLAPEERWLAERYSAVRTSESADGSLLAELPVSSGSWAAGLVARSGGGVRVVGPSAVVAEVRESLSRARGRYADTHGWLAERKGTLG